MVAGLFARLLYNTVPGLFSKEVSAQQIVKLE